MKFESNKDYVRQVLAETVNLTGRNAGFIDRNQLPEDDRYYLYERDVHVKGKAPSTKTIELMMQKRRKDYRVQTEGEHPVERLRGSAPRESAFPHAV